MAAINVVGFDNRSLQPPAIRGLCNFHKERKLPLARDLSNQHLVKAPAELDCQPVV